MTSKIKFQKLDEIADIIDSLHKTPKYVENGIPMVRCVDLNYGELSLADTKKVSEETYLQYSKKYKPAIDDIIITRVGAYYGDTSYVNENMFCLGQNTASIIPYENKRYIYYFLNSKLGREQMAMAVAGAAQPTLSLKAIRNLEVPRLGGSTERWITNILSCLDDKIAINNKVCKTLEQIAQAIFKSWFVDFEPTKAKIAAREALLTENPAATPEQIATAEQQAAIQAIAGAGDIIPTEQLQTIAGLFPNQLVDSELGEIPYGWEIKALDQIAHYQNGLALQKFRPENGEDFLPVLKIAQLKAGFADGKEVAKATIKKECIVDNSDVIFSWSGSLVVDIWCGGKVALNQHLFKVTSDTYPKWFYYKWTKYHLEKFQQIAADKAVTMGHIKRSHLSEAKCLIPTSELLNNKCISSLINKQVQVRLESKVLSEVRDSLLPRLLTGEFSLGEEDSDYE
tara:strand:+ start:3011 stop:4375 length:1365 start_codon:yes stop_codon:yes gene_type:complete